MSQSHTATPDPSPLSSTMYPESTASSATTPTAASAGRKPSVVDARKYSCQFCSRAFSRSEHRSRHERSHTKERPFKCLKCRSTFVRRDLLLRHDRTVHAKDGGVPLQNGDTKRRSTASKPSQIVDSAVDESSPQETEYEYQTQSQRSVNNGTQVNYLGLEEAAMLMTNFQQKAALTTNQHDHNTHDPALHSGTPSSSAHLTSEPNSAYSPATAMASPQMHWDSIPSQSRDQATLSSLRPDLGPYPYPQLHAHGHATPYNNTSPAQTIDPAIANIHQSRMHTPSVAPLQTNPASTALMSGLATPESFSPHPPMNGGTGSSPVDSSRKSLPQLGMGQRSSDAPQIPRIDNQDQMASVLANIERCDSAGVVFDTVQLPEAAVLNRYLSAYFNLFHHHLPFLHQPSFDPTQVCAPLMLAVLSIGALYTFDQNHAYMLHIGSKMLVNQFLANKENFSSRKSPLWAMQATLLNMYFASWSGDIRGLEWACSIKSLVANMVAGNRYELKLRTQTRPSGLPCHKEWIEDEECRRTYYAVYVFFGLLTLTFNHTPAISFNEFDALELPCTESVWNIAVQDEQDWREKLVSSAPTTFKQAHHSLFQGTPVQYSAFATRIMVNALFLEVWYHKRSPEALQDVVTEYKLRLALDTWHKSLDMCNPEVVAIPLSTPNRAHPLIFNAMAMYRNTVVRLVVDLMCVQEALRYHSSHEVATAMTLARDKVSRSDEMLRVVSACFDCIEVAATQGIRWVARTSATNWSIEHPLCGVDLILILSHWVCMIENDERPPTPDEKEMYSKVRNLFDDDSRGPYSRELGSTVARLWGSMIDEVVVWGITKLMGESFKLHAQSLSDSEDSSPSGGAALAPMTNVQATRN